MMEEKEQVDKQTTSNHLLKTAVGYQTILKKNVKNWKKKYFFLENKY